jgi:hypothetical protein
MRAAIIFAAAGRSEQSRRWFIGEATWKYRNWGTDAARSHEPSVYLSSPIWAAKVSPNSAKMASAATDAVQTSMQKIGPILRLDCLKAVI